MENKIRIFIKVESGVRILSGRDEGALMRRSLLLEDKDRDHMHYIIDVPNVMAITASYFLACFGKSIRRLGKEKFCDKYEFSTKTNIVRENIEAGIDSAINIAMPF